MNHTNNIHPDYQKVWEEQYETRVKGEKFQEEKGEEFRALLNERL